jgi:hypothetical protein
VSLPHTFLINIFAQKQKSTAKSKNFSFALRPFRHPIFAFFASVFALAVHTMAMDGDDTKRNSSQSHITSTRTQLDTTHPKPTRACAPSYIRGDGRAAAYTAAGRYQNITPKQSSSANVPITIRRDLLMCRMCLECVSNLWR